jgi:hypothetical protein
LELELDLTPHEKKNLLIMIGETINKSETGTLGSYNILNRNCSSFVFELLNQALKEPINSPDRHSPVLLDTMLEDEHLLKTKEYFSPENWSGKMKNKAIRKRWKSRLHRKRCIILLCSRLSHCEVRHY